MVTTLKIEMNKNQNQSTEWSASLTRITEILGFNPGVGIDVCVRHGKKNWG